MRRIFVVLLVPAAVASAALAPGCSSSDNGAADASIDGFGVIVGGGDGGGDGGGQAGGDGGVGGVQTTMRLAHASPDLGPVDFCWRKTGSQAFTGPVLTGGPQPGDAGDAGSAEAAPGALDAGAGDATAIDVAVPEAATADDGAAGGDGDATGGDGEAGGPAVPGALVFGAMTAAVQLPAAGTFDVALVTPGQSSCYPSRLAGQVTLSASKSVTAVIMGLAAPDAGPSSALAIVPFTDAALDPQRARVRLIHAALGSSTEGPSPPFSVRAGTTLLAAEVDPMKATTASTAPSVDSLGYATVQPLDAPTVLWLTSIGDPQATTWSSQPDPDLHVQVGTAHTGILVSLDQGALGVVWCSDAPTTSTPASCKTIVASN